MNRDQALEELKLRLINKDIIFRSLVVEAVMEDLAKLFNADVNLWGLTGLLHDIDYEKTLNKPEQHGIIGAEILENLNFDEAIVYSVRAHNDANGITRKRKMDKALYLSDYVVQQVIAGYNGLDKKQLEEPEESVLKAIEEKASEFDKFNELNIAKREFIKLVINSLRRIA